MRSATTIPSCKKIPFKYIYSCENQEQSFIRAGRSDLAIKYLDSTGILLEFYIFCSRFARLKNKITCD